MRAKVIFIVTIYTIIAPITVSFPTEHNKPQNSSSDTQKIRYSTPSRQTIDFRTGELTNQQSENVRHIIATEQQRQERERQDGSRQVKKEKAIITVEDEGFPTLEELRAKCQHFSRLFGLSQSESNSMEHYANHDTASERHSTVLPHRNNYNNRPIIEATRRPVFIRNKPTFIQKNNGGFYVTASSTGNEITSTKKSVWSSTTPYPRVAYISSEHSTTASPTTTPSTNSRMTTTFYVSNQRVKNTTPNSSTTSSTTRPKIKIKYTKFEPVILQKTILTDGRVLYHWHRSLPTAAVDLPAPIAPIVTPIVEPSTYEFPPVPATVPLSHRNLGPIETSTLEVASSTTTTEKSSWLFVPFSNLFGGSHEEETTTVESNTATPSTSSASTTIKNKLETKEPLYATTEDTKFAQQLKLVVPVHYDDIDATLAAQNNKLPYYRKVTESKHGVVPSPSLQIIKALGMPQSIPRYSLGYTGTGYGLTINDGIPFGGSYSPGYVNYQPYSHIPIERKDMRLDDVSV